MISDAAPNALGLYEFHLISNNPTVYGFDELSIIESDKGFDLTGDRQVLGATAVELFREQMVASEDAKIWSVQSSSLPNIPAISKPRPNY